jgi:hypothetical protein
MPHSRLFSYRTAHGPDAGSTGATDRRSRRLGDATVSVHALDVLWTQGNWRVVYTGATVFLHVDRILVSSKQVVGRSEAEAVAANWRRSVLDVIEMEQQAERLEGK